MYDDDYGSFFYHFKLNWISFNEQLASTSATSKMFHVSIKIQLQHKLFSTDLSMLNV